MQSPRRRVAAFTLVELMIGVALIAVIVALAAPSFREMILMQRLRGVNAQVVTDANFARSEAISRASYMQVRFQTSSGANAMSCYVIYARPNSAASPVCDCTQPEGLRCTDPSTIEVRTVQVMSSDSVYVQVPSGDDIYTIDPRTGGLVLAGLDLPGGPGDNILVDAFIDTPRKFRNRIGQTGRVSTCIPVSSTIGGIAC